MFDAENIAAQREAEYYDLVTDWRHDADFFTALAKEHGGPILELGCGTGRITLQIARTGITIEGLDLGVERLRIAEAANSALPPQMQARFHHADMRTFVLDHTFRMAMFPYRVLQELTTVADKMDCLRQVHAHLDHDGLLLIDNYSPSIPYLAADPSHCTTSCEKLGPAGETIRYTQLVLSRDYSNQTQQLQVVYDISYLDESTEHFVIPYETSYMFRFELEHLLSRCGFTVCSVWGGYGFEPFADDSPGELIVLAQRADQPM
ncbi:class I SAM-dependent methyltransferase [Nocardia ninae]|uniref:Type 12 methyltransferase n=1 Tax=Nocardia ninae NBRC 108245 TaxID=1210091 RepID=A0A511MC74_9NOCA|nr:class I SAM-dependent methyltransferase [Nocardia ninae]GEM38230.1 type 12 methyltransferase [Nocardia ninae NBRC 108245]